MLPKWAAVSMACLWALSLWHNFWFRFGSAAFVTSHRKYNTRCMDSSPYPSFPWARKLKGMQMWISARHLLAGWWKLQINPMSNPSSLVFVKDTTQEHSQIHVTTVAFCVCVVGLILLVIFSLPNNYLGFYGQSITRPIYFCQKSCKQKHVL